MRQTRPSPPFLLVCTVIGCTTWRCRWKRRCPSMVETSSTSPILSPNRWTHLCIYSSLGGSTFPVRSAFAAFEAFSAVRSVCTRPCPHWWQKSVWTCPPWLTMVREELAVERDIQKRRPSLDTQKVKVLLMEVEQVMAAVLHLKRGDQNQRVRVVKRVRHSLLRKRERKRKWRWRRLRKAGAKYVGKIIHLTAPLCATGVMRSITLTASCQLSLKYQMEIGTAVTAGI
mmetsp:Transcript_25894/g.65591  ORF Transcript_25894/g.65591 Transcript_25894/m.65591 type:complete len:228 (-) Transcript_25894:2687-3370(-)